MTGYHTTSLQSDNVKDIGEINNSPMIEAEVTKNNKTIGKLKYYSVYQLHDAKRIFQDRPLETFVNDDNKMNENVEKRINGNINKLSVNVINCSLLLKQWLTGKFNSFLKHNMIMSGLNTEKLLMLLKFKSVMMQ